MNTILQKRIEEAARDIAELCPDCDFHCESPNPCVPKILYQKLVEIANFALQHQWISVEEALPEEIYQRVLALNHHFPLDVYLGRYENGKWILDTEDQELWITHWMPIPSLKGGEK